MKIQVLRIQFTFAIALLQIFATTTHGQSLADALNATNLTWTTSGTNAGGWSAESSVTHDGISAARSAFVSSPGPNGAYSILQTTVVGPGTVTFWWYQSGGDSSTLSFVVNGVSQATFVDLGLWRKQTFYLGSGMQTLQWINSVTSSFLPYNGYGYLDEVTYIPGATAPLITVQPFSQSQVSGMNTTFAVTAGGTPPLSYQWQLNGTNIPGATASSYTVTNTLAGDLGNYRVIITNHVDTLASSNASLEFGEVTAWNLPGLGRTSVAPGATNVLEVAASSTHSLILKSPGKVLAFGDIYDFDNNYGDRIIPAGATNVIAVSAGDHTSTLLKSDGTVLVLGNNYAFDETNVPSGLSNVVAITSGRSHCLALKSDGTVVAWGFDFDGETNVPPGLSNVVAMGAGDFHSLALKSDGSVVAWGWGGSGQTNVPPDLTNAVAVAGGVFHSLALKSDGTVVAWGDNTYGQTNIPSGLTNVVAIAAFDVHNLALKSDGTVAAWGGSSFGGTNVPANLSHVVAIATGQNYNMAVVGNGPPLTQMLMSNPSVGPDGFSVTVPTQCGHVYRLEYMTSLDDANWTPLPLVAGIGKDLVLRDPTVSSSQRFYRVRRW